MTMKDESIGYQYSIEKGFKHLQGEHDQQSHGGNRSGDERHNYAAFREVSASEFISHRDMMPESLQQFLSPYSAKSMKQKDYAEKKAKLYLMTDKTAGYAIAKDGDIISVFSKPGFHHGQEAIKSAITNGGKKLDCFDIKQGSKVNLPKLYKKFGFKIISNLKWGDQYAPKNWNYERYGRPNVAFMKL